MISFIIPTYNRAHTISLSIESIINQTNHNWELIIVDDGSQDETEKYIEPFLKDSRIKYSYQQNQGVSAARNHGGDLAKGEYLIFLDSDDIINQNLLEQLNTNSYNFFDLICWEVQKTLPTEIEIIKARNLGPLFNNRTANFLAGSFCCKKELFWKIGGYDTDITFGENYELGIRICNFKNLKIKLIDKGLLEYFVDNSKRTSNSISNRLFSLFKQYKKHKLIYQTHRRLNAKAFYFFGYLLEKSSKYKFAAKFYLISWRLTPWNMKYMLKYFLLKLNRR